MTIDKIQEIVMTVIASAGGIGGLIAVITTVIKVFGGNSVKARLAATKIELDKTMAQGLADIYEAIIARINTDISIDIGAKINEAVEAQLQAQGVVNEHMLEEINLTRTVMGLLLSSQSELRVLSEDTRKQLAAKGEEVAQITPVKHAVKPVAHITLAPEPTPATPAEEPKTDKPAAMRAVL